MSASYQGASIALKVRDFGTSQVFKTVTCLETTVLDASNDVNTKKTKCGVFKGIITPPDFKISGQGVQNISPSATEYSFDQLQVDQANGQKKEFRIEDPTFGTVVQINGGGYWTQSQATYNNGETMNFTFTMEVDGNINTSES